jgi:hypothetical protein
LRASQGDGLGAFEVGGSDAAIRQPHVNIHLEGGVQRADGVEVNRDGVGEDLVEEVLREMNVAGPIEPCGSIVPPECVPLHQMDASPLAKGVRDGKVGRGSRGNVEAEDGEIDQAVELFPELHEGALSTAGRSEPIFEAKSAREGPGVRRGDLVRTASVIIQARARRG